MSLTRIRIDVALPYPLPTELSNLFNQIRALQAAVLPYEVDGVASNKASWHICHNKETPPKPCEPEQEI